MSKFTKNENYLFKTKNNNKMNAKNMQLIPKGVNQTSFIIPPHLDFLHFQAKTRKES